MSDPCPAPSTPTGQTPTVATGTGWTFLGMLCLPLRFMTRLLDANDQAVSAQVLAFCTLFPFSIYWLQTRLNPSAQWTICFGTIWGAVAFHEYFRHRGGG